MGRKFHHGYLLKKVVLFFYITHDILFNIVCCVLVGWCVTWLGCTTLVES